MMTEVLVVDDSVLHDGSISILETGTDIILQVNDGTGY